MKIGMLLLAAFSLIFLQACLSVEICNTGSYCDEDFDLGCFEQGEKTGYCQHVYQPEPIKTMDMSIEVYTYANQYNPQPLDLKDKHLLRNSISNLRLEREKALYLIVHGYSYGDPSMEWPHAMERELRDQTVTTLVVNWVGGADSILYNQAAANTRIVGALLGKVLRHISEDFHIPACQMTIVGFSLGAHVAGFAGKKFRGVGRIIGLDPAGVLFGGRWSTWSRLHRSDANYVVAMHTDSNKFGSSTNMGHVDIYVNSGQDQTGCNGYDPFDTCDHKRAVHIFLSWLRYHLPWTNVMDCPSYEDWAQGKCWTLAKTDRTADDCVNHLESVLYLCQNQNLNKKCMNRTVFYHAQDVDVSKLLFKAPTNFRGLSVSDVMF